MKYNVRYLKGSWGRSVTSMMTVFTKPVVSSLSGMPYSPTSMLSVSRRCSASSACDSEWWRDACLLYFQTFSKRPIPSDVEHPVHNLDEMMRFRIPISMYENPESGYNK